METKWSILCILYNLINDWVNTNKPSLDHHILYAIQGRPHFKLKRINNFIEISICLRQV